MAKPTAAIMLQGTGSDVGKSLVVAALCRACVRHRAVQAAAHFLARLEHRNDLLSNRNMLAGARIASHPGVALLDREGAKTADFDPIAPRQSSHDLLQDGVDHVFRVALVELWILVCDLLDEFGLDHRQILAASGRDRRELVN
jgi:hypothetical protein